jgi:hypothetical protein
MNRLKNSQPNKALLAYTHMLAMPITANESISKSSFLPREFTHANLLNERTEKQSLKDDEASEGTEDRSYASPSNASVEEKHPETPFTRESLQDMRGLGATNTDNRLIELTFSTREPLRLNSVNFLNGSVYSGEWLAGKRHDQGTLVWADGSRYDGEWR